MDVTEHDAFCSESRALHIIVVIVIVIIVTLKCRFQVKVPCLFILIALPCPHLHQVQSAIMTRLGTLITYWCQSGGALVRKFAFGTRYLTRPVGSAHPLVAGTVKHEGEG